MQAKMRPVGLREFARVAKTVAIIGAGQIGYAAAKAFRAEGWDVRVLARSKPKWLTPDITFERHVLGDNEAATGDVVLDTIPYDADDVTRFDPGKVGRYIAVSSAAVYCDEKGRSFETPDLGFPEIAHAIEEDQPRLSPGPETYSSKKVRMEDKALELFGERTVLLRPSAIYGEHSRQPREWWFVKRLLDGRRRIALSHNGESRFHTTNADMIGEFALLAAEKDLSGAYNLADANAPTVREIGEIAAEHLGCDTEFVGFDGPPRKTVGASPWAIPTPFILSSDKAAAAGLPHGLQDYAPGRYLDWLVDQKDEDWKALFPVLAGYGYDLFDYEAEDRFLASL